MSCCTFKLLSTLLASFLPRFLLKVTLRTVGCTGTSELIMSFPCEGDVQEQNPAMGKCDVHLQSLTDSTELSVCYNYICLHSMFTGVCEYTYSSHLLLFITLPMLWEGSGTKGMYELYILLFIAPSSEAATSDGFSTFLVSRQNGSAVTAKGAQAKPAVLDVTTRWPLLRTATEEAELQGLKS